MTLIKLTKVKYVGEGYVHFYKEIATEKEIIIPCTKEQYENLNNIPAPEVEGLEFTKISAGGCIHVDTPKYLIQENEYCDFEGEYYAVFKDSNGLMFGGKLSKDKIVDDFVDNQLE